MIAQIPATVHSPITTPIKNGNAFRYSFIPPVHIMTNLTSHPMNMPNHIWWIVNVFARAYPEGLSGHHRKRIRINVSPSITIMPNSITNIPVPSISNGWSIRWRKDRNGIFVIPILHP